MVSVCLAIHKAGCRRRHLSLPGKTPLCLCSNASWESTAGGSRAALAACLPHRAVSRFPDGAPFSWDPVGVHTDVTWRRPFSPLGPSIFICLRGRLSSDLLPVCRERACPVGCQDHFPLESRKAPPIVKRSDLCMNRKASQLRLVVKNPSANAGNSVGSIPELRTTEKGSDGSETKQCLLGLSCFPTRSAYDEDVMFSDALGQWSLGRCPTIPASPHLASRERLQPADPSAPDPGIDRPQFVGRRGR